MIFLLGITTLIAVVSADVFTDPCVNCEFNSGGIGYVEGKNCRQFLQCFKSSGAYVVRCCANGTGWNQDVKACDHRHCNAGFDGCPIDTSNSNNDYCPFKDDWVDCPPGTVFSVKKCACVHGGNKRCYDDPLLHFPFADDFDDIQCPRAAGRGFGNAKIDSAKGCLKLDGDGDYMTFSYMNNWFVGNKPKYFTLSMWFRQTQDGFDNVNNLPEGLFSNGNCDGPETIWLQLQNATANGGIKADAIAEFSGVDPARDYGPADEWRQIAIRYARGSGKVTLFLDGVSVGQVNAQGNIMDSMTDSSVGLSVLQCIPYFFTGCIDDVMVFVREVSDAEMLDCVFGNGRTVGNSKAMYSCPQHQ